MTTNVLKRNESLCNKFEMDFDEANELFGKETLNSMQMVQVNGGSITFGSVLLIAAAVCTIIATAIVVYDHLTSTEGDTGPSAKITKEGSGGFSIEQPQSGSSITTTTYRDSVIIIKPDGTIEKHYNETETTTATY